MFRKESPASFVDKKELLGMGSFGAVYRGVLLNRNQLPSGELQDQDVAVKIISYSGDELTQLGRELYFLKNLSSPFIVKYVDSFVSKDELWIVMELCDSGSLLDICQATKTSLAENELKAVFSCCILGLIHIHERRSIHRDIKAGNILLSSKGKAMLSDFGVSTQLTDSNRRRTVIGTPYWMAPEILQETSYGENADIWSLGVTLIECAQGAPPHFDAKPLRAMYMIASKPAPRFAEESKWSPDMIHFLDRCLQKDPYSRASSNELESHPWISSEINEIAMNEKKGEGAYLKILQVLARSSQELIKEMRRVRQETADSSTFQTFQDINTMETEINRGAGGGVAGTWRTMETAAFNQGGTAGAAADWRTSSFNSGNKSNGSLAVTSVDEEDKNSSFIVLKKDGKSNNTTPINNSKGNNNIITNSSSNKGKDVSKFDDKSTASSDVATWNAAAFANNGFGNNNNGFGKGNGVVEKGGTGVISEMSTPENTTRQPISLTSPVPKQVLEENEVKVANALMASRSNTIDTLRNQLGTLKVSHDGLNFNNNNNNSSKDDKVVNSLKAQLDRSNTLRNNRGIAMKSNSRDEMDGDTDADTMRNELGAASKALLRKQLNNDRENNGNTLDLSNSYSFERLQRENSNLSTPTDDGRVVGRQRSSSLPAMYNSNYNNNSNINGNQAILQSSSSKESIRIQSDSANVKTLKTVLNQASPASPATASLVPFSARESTSARSERGGEREVRDVREMPLNEFATVSVNASNGKSFSSDVSLSRAHDLGTEMQSSVGGGQPFIAVKKFDDFSSVNEEGVPLPVGAVILSSQEGSLRYDQHEIQFKMAIYGRGGRSQGCRMEVRFGNVGEF